MNNYHMLLKQSLVLAIGIFFLIVPTRLFAADFELISTSAEPSSNRWAFSGVDPNAVCTSVLEQSSYRRTCKDSSGKIIFVVAVRFQFRNCSQGSKLRLCIDIPSAIAHGPNGGFNGIGSAVLFTVSGASGNARIGSSSGGFLDSKVHDIAPKSPIVFDLPPNTSIVTVNALTSRNLRRKWELKISPQGEAQPAGADCLGMRRELHGILAKLADKNREYDSWQNTFDQFYEESKLDMCVVYQDLDWKIKNPVPFMSDISISKPASLTGGVDHLPKLIVNSPVSRRSKMLAILGELEKIADYIPMVGEYIGTFKSAFATLTEKKMDYYEGLAIHKKYTESRKKMLDQYSHVMTLLYCDQILPIQSEILVFRDRKLPKSSCNAMERQVLITDVTRGSTIRNSEHLIRAEDYCRNYLKALVPAQKKSQRSLEQQRLDYLLQQPLQTK